MFGSNAVISYYPSSGLVVQLILLEAFYKIHCAKMFAFVKNAVCSLLTYVFRI